MKNMTLWWESKQIRTIFCQNDDSLRYFTGWCIISKWLKSFQMHHSRHHNKSKQAVYVVQGSWRENSSEASLEFLILQRYNGAVTSLLVYVIKIQNTKCFKRLMTCHFSCFIIQFWKMIFSCIRHHRTGCNVAAPLCDLSKLLTMPQQTSKFRLIMQKPNLNWKSISLRCHFQNVEFSVNKLFADGGLGERKRFIKMISNNDLTLTVEFPDDGVQEGVLRGHVAPPDRHLCCGDPSVFEDF